jgi:hypothetical protein
MVHNGIEYGDMQLIAEAWDLLRRGLRLSAAEAGGVFARWDRGPLESFLTSLTARVARVVDHETGQPLVDVVLDRAAQKGTGRWTAQVALDLAVPIPTIAAAIDARVLSADRETRLAVARVLSGPAADDAGTDAREEVLAAAHDALYAARVATYAQGMALIQAASRAQGWGIDLAEIARIWTAGCIIRARLLEDVARPRSRRVPGSPRCCSIRRWRHASSRRCQASAGRWRPPPPPGCRRPPTPRPWRTSTRSARPSCRRISSRLSVTHSAPTATSAGTVRDRRTRRGTEVSSAL